MATVEERLAAIEARIGPSPLALVPPVTIGELTNVPAPGSQIAAAWAQDVSSRIVQRFPTKAAVDAWAAPNGCYAVQLDNGVLWRRIGGVWSMFTPWTTSQAGVANNGAPGTSVANQMNLPADPAQRICNLSCFVVVSVVAQNQCFVNLNFNGVAVAQGDIMSNDINAGGGVPPKWNIALAAYNNIIPANTSPNVSVTIIVDNNVTAGRATVYGEFYRNRMDVTILPKGY